MRCLPRYDYPYAGVRNTRDEHAGTEGHHGGRDPEEQTLHDSTPMIGNMRGMILTIRGGAIESMQADRTNSLDCRGGLRSRERMFESCWGAHHDQTKPGLSRTNAVTLGCCPRRHRRAAHPCVPARCPGRAIADPPSGSSAGWMLAMNPAPAKTPRMASLVNTATATPRTTPIPTRTVISNRWLVRSVLVIVVLPPAMARALAAISRRYARLLRSRWAPGVVASPGPLVP